MASDSPTGRSTDSQPQIQNLPMRTPEAARVRAAFVTPYAQWAAQAAAAEKTMLRMFEAHRQRLRDDGYQLVEQTSMYERWKHPDGREVTIE